MGSGRPDRPENRPRFPPGPSGPLGRLRESARTVGTGSASDGGRLAAFFCKHSANEPLKTRWHGASGPSDEKQILQGKRQDPKPAVTAENGPCLTFNPMVGTGIPGRLAYPVHTGLQGAGFVGLTTDDMSVAVGRLSIYQQVGTEGHGLTAEWSPPWFGQSRLPRPRAFIWGTMRTAPMS